MTNQLRWNSAFTLLAVIVVLVMPLTAKTKVSVAIVGNAHNTDYPMEASVSNEEASPITFCAEFAIQIDGKPTPMPFQVLKSNHGRWEIVLTSPDVGNLHSPVILGAKSSSHFKLRLRTPGKYKLRLWYIVGAKEDSKCPLGKSKRKDSRVFRVGNNQ